MRQKYYRENIRYKVHKYGDKEEFCGILRKYKNMPSYSVFNNEKVGWELVCSKRKIYETGAKLGKVGEDKYCKISYIDIKLI